MTTLTDTQVITASGGLVELGYSQITSNVSIDNATAGTGKEVIAPLTVVCDGSPVAVEFFAPSIRGSATQNDQIIMSLFRDGSELSRFWCEKTTQSTAGPDDSTHLTYRDTPSAGSHTYSVKAYVTNASRVGTVKAGNTTTGYSPAFLRVSKIVQATQWPAVTTGTIICTSSTRPASPFEGQEIYETDTDTKYVWSGAAWLMSSVPNATAIRRVVANNNTFTNQTSYADFPNATDKAAMDATFVKRSSSSALLVSVHTACSFDSGVAQMMYVGLSVGGTDYDIAAMQFPAAANRQSWSGERLLTGISSGSLAVKPRFKAGGASSVVFYANNDYVHYSVMEVTG